MRLKTGVIIAFTFISLVTGFAANAQLSSTAVDSLVQNAMKQFNVAGVAVAIVKDGKVIHKKGYGVRSISNNLPVDEHTNFEIASNSKAFTTAALSILMDEGKLNWNDKVRNYLPEFKLYNDYVTENFTIADLLCHRSGLGLGAGDLMSFPDGTDFTIKDVLVNLQHFKPVSPFRTQFDYDNQLYFIAGELIARVSGMTWENFIQAKIMEPLQMQHSFAALSAIKDRGNVATPHSTETPDSKIKTITLFEEMINGAAGGILSNVDDMSKWVLMQLNKGKYGDSLKKQLFKEARQREMWTIHTVIPANPNPRYNSHFSGYGLGWFLDDAKGNMMVSHTGGLPGMLSKVGMIPDLKLGIIILTNTENGGGALFSAVYNSIADSYLGVEKLDWVGRYAKRMEARKGGADSVTKKVWQAVAVSKNSKINPADFTGVYEDKWFGKMEVFLKNGQLWIKAIRSPKLVGQMQLYKANTFAIKWDYQDMNCDALAMFGLDEEGKAQRIKMKGISPDIDFSFDFQDLDLQRIK
ncbi:MAG: serine hydrolase [Rhizobacter sp.]|nr:serine hydrolase [Ferruginibacter sp.]